MAIEAGVPPSTALSRARGRDRENASSASTARRVVWVTVGAYGVAFAAAAALHYLVFQTGHEDLGNMAQAVWSTAHGHFLQVTAGSGREVTRLAAHVEPFLVLLVPLWWIWGSPTMLVVLEAVVVAIGALPVFWLACKHLKSDRAAAHFALAYLIFPATQFNAFEPSGFHAVSLAVPFVLFAIWFLDEDRLVLFGLFALLAASTEEQIPLAVGCLGIWYAVRRGHRLAGMAIFSVGAAASLVSFLVVIPHFSVSGIDPFSGRYKQVGGTPTGMLHTLVSDPTAFVHTAATTHKLIYVLLLFAPFLALWLWEPLLLLGAVPQLAIDLFSSRPEQTEIPYHYTAGIVPFVIAASVLGAGRLRRDPARLSFFALIAVACAAVYSPLLLIRPDIADYSSTVRAAKAHAVNMVPRDAPVSASNQLGSALSMRRYAYLFPTIGSATWVIVDRDDPTYDADGYARAIRLIESSANWKTVYSSHGIAVLRRATAG